MTEQPCVACLRCLALFLASLTWVAAAVAPDWGLDCEEPGAGSCCCLHAPTEL